MCLQIKIRNENMNTDVFTDKVRNENMNTDVFTDKGKK